MTRRGSGSGRGSRGGQIAKAALFSLAGAGIAWLVVKTAIVYALVDADPYKVSAIAPDDPRVAMDIALVEFAKRNGDISERARSRSYAALAKEPLSDIPMLVAALKALTAGDTAMGERLLVESRHRDPRSRAAHLLLLDRYLRTNRIEEAAIEIAVLHRLVPEAGAALIPQLAGMASNPRTAPALMRVLARDPSLQQDVLSRLATTGADPDVILAAARDALASGGGATQEWQRVLLKRLVDKGDYGRAYALWRSFARLPATASSEKGVQDGNFSDARGAPPFNWQLNSGNGGVAERAGGSNGLQVQYFGRDSTDLAAQLLLLLPGSYTLKITLDGNASGEGARLSWSVACAGGSEKLAEIPLTKIDSTRKILAAKFDIPAGCAAQWVKLAGAPTDLPTEQDVTIHEVSIERAGS